MDSTEKLTEKKPEETPQQDKNLVDSRYSIYLFFKDHTAFLVACVSALIAALSFLLKYAAGRYTEGFLRYWMIDAVYARESKTELIYVILTMLLFSLVTVLAHKVMSLTANAFEYHVRNLTAIEGYYRDSKRQLRAARNKKKKTQCRSYIETENQEVRGGRTSTGDGAAQQKVNEAETCIERIKSMRCSSLLWVVVNVVCAVITVFFMVYIAAHLMASSHARYCGWRPAMFAGEFVIMDLLLYFIPAYRRNRVKRENFREISLQQLEEEMSHTDEHRFPISSITDFSIRMLLSNRAIYRMTVGFVAIVTMLVLSFSSAGKTDAKKMTVFPIYTENGDSYAVVYNSGEALVLKSAIVEGSQIRIDVTKQRVISAKEAAYELCNFESVIMIGKDGE